MDAVERQQLIERLRLDAARIADHFGLALRALEAEHPRVTSRYGVCYETGLIKIRLNHAKTGKPLRYSSLVDTLCHELAHLRHFDHGPAFKAFFLRLLGWARRQGIYQPAPRRQAAPAALHRPHAAPLAPERRNGVPVFRPAPAESEAARRLCAAFAARDAAPAQPIPAPAPAREAAPLQPIPAPAPAPTREAAPLQPIPAPAPAPARDAAPAQPIPAPAREAAPQPPSPAPPRRRRPTPVSTQQLSLFSD